MKLLFMTKENLQSVLPAVLALAAVCAVIMLFIAAYSYVKTYRMAKRIDKMLDSAIDGSFSESIFDETVMSALENKLWKYLSSAETSARRTAQERDKIKTLIADISHQTKTPISNIQLYSELLAEQELSAEAAEYVGKIETQSKKLGFLINSLVKLSRLETGIIELHPKRGRVAPMLEDVVAEYTGKAAERGIALAVADTRGQDAAVGSAGNVSDPVTARADAGSAGSVSDPVTAWAGAEAVFDEKWTAEALGNIVDNAVKYTERGRIELFVREYEMFVCVEVRDTGIGIAEEEQSKIFSRFYRSKNVAEKSGVGIGLYLAREIVARQGGYIRVSSEPGKGSVFSVFLPR